MKNDNVQQTPLVSSPQKEAENLYKGFQLPMIKNFHFDECASALQKSIRRSLEFEATYWAGVFYRSGYSKYLAKRLKVIIEEDVADPTCLILVNQLYLVTQVKGYQTEQDNDGFLKYVNLIILACRSKKSRISDELGNVVLDLIDKLDVRLTLDNDYLDPHTTIGKIQHGRWDDNEHKGKALDRIKKWFTVWSYLDNENKDYRQYKKLNEMIWKLPYLSGKEKENIISSVKKIVNEKRDEIHKRIDCSNSSSD